jgi:hypothetical protein
MQARICPVSKCGRLIPKDSSRCSNHTLEGIYTSARWRNQTRPTVLERDGYRCRICSRGQDETRLDVAHRGSTTTLLLSGVDPYDAAWCLTICATCHGKWAAVVARHTTR